MHVILIASIPCIFAHPKHRCSLSSLSFCLAWCDQTFRTKFRKVSRLALLVIEPDLSKSFPIYNERQARVSRNIREICPVLIARPEKGGGLLHGANVYVCVRFFPILTCDLTPAQSTTETWYRYFIGTSEVKIRIERRLKKHIFLNYLFPLMIMDDIARRHVDKISISKRRCEISLKSIARDTRFVTSTLFQFYMKMSCNLSSLDKNYAAVNKRHVYKRN